eukprot:RCo047995
MLNGTALLGSGISITSKVHDVEALSALAKQMQNPTPAPESPTETSGAPLTIMPPPGTPAALPAPPTTASAPAVLPNTVPVAAAAQPAAAAAAAPLSPTVPAPPTAEPVNVGTLLTSLLADPAQNAQMLITQLTSLGGTQALQAAANLNALLVLQLGYDPNNPPDYLIPQTQCKPEELAKTMYVSGIDPKVTSEQLVRHFSACGPVAFHRLPPVPPSATSRFAFIEFLEIGGALAAMSLNGVPLAKTPIKVMKAFNCIAKEKRPEPEVPPEQPLSKVDEPVEKVVEKMQKSKSRSKSKPRSAASRSRSRSHRHYRRKSRERSRRRSRSPKRSHRRSRDRSRDRSRGRRDKSKTKGKDKDRKTSGSESKHGSGAREGSEIAADKTHARKLSPLAGSAPASKRSVKEPSVAAVPRDESPSGEIPPELPPFLPEETATSSSPAQPDSPDRKASSRRKADSKDHRRASEINDDDSCEDAGEREGPSDQKDRHRESHHRQRSPAATPHSTIGKVRHRHDLRDSKPTDDWSSRRDVSSRGDHDSRHRSPIKGSSRDGTENRKSGDRRKYISVD